MVLLFTFVPFIANLLSGRLLTTFSKRRFEFRPILYSSILAQAFLLLKDLNSWVSEAREYYIHPVILIILGLQITILFYETIFVKSGIYEKGIILYGLFFEWASIVDCHKEESEDQSSIIVIKHTNDRLRRIIVDGAKAEEICEIIKTLTRGDI